MERKEGGKGIAIKVFGSDPKGSVDGRDRLTVWDSCNQFPEIPSSRGDHYYPQQTTQQIMERKEGGKGIAIKVFGSDPKGSVDGMRWSRIA
jgi:hypothetical protein